MSAPIIQTIVFAVIKTKIIMGANIYIQIRANTQVHPYKIKTPSVFGIHPSTRGELLRVSGPWSVVGVYFQDTPFYEKKFYLLISHFLLIHFYS